MYVYNINLLKDHDVFIYIYYNSMWFLNRDKNNIINTVYKLYVIN